MAALAATCSPGRNQGDAGKSGAGGKSAGKGAAGRGGAGKGGRDSGPPDAGHSNTPPVANAGDDQVVKVGDQVTLDGSGSTDADGDKLTFRWTLNPPAGSGAALSSTSAVKPTFKVDRSGVYHATPVVNDGKIDSAPDEALVSTGDNVPPVANAGPDQSVKVGDTVALDGSGSHDANGDSITFAWRITSKPASSSAELSDATAMKPTFTIDVAGDYTIELVVSDGVSTSTPASVLVSTGNAPPVAAIAEPSTPVFVDQTVALDGSGSSDVNNDPLTYRWSLSVPAGSTAKIDPDNTSQTSFVPDRRGDYLVQLIVNDGRTDSAPATRLVQPQNRAPVANAGPDQNAREGDSVHLDGTGSTDPDHDTLSYQWRIASQPSGSTASLSNATSAQPTLNVDVEGTYHIELVVSDGDLSSAPDALDVTVTRGPPRVLDFSPKQAPWGAVIDITGSRLSPATGAPVVHLSARAGGTLEAPVATFADDGIRIVVPAGAATGPIGIDIGSEHVDTVDPLTIVPSTTFSLSAAPSSADLMPGQSVAYVVHLDSSDGFPLLAPLQVTGLPSGITASLKPAQIAAGHWSLLTLTADAGQPVGAVPFQVHATSTVDGIPIEQVVGLAVNVVPITTSFVGRAVVSDDPETPLAGVTVTLLPRDGNGQMKNCSGTTTTDAAGNFAFTNLPAGCEGEQMIEYNGLTTTAPAGKYAGVDLVYSILPGQVTAAPILIHLPRIDDAETVMVKQNAAQDQTFTFKTIPNLTVTVYAGTTLTLADGTTPDPFPWVAVDVPIDRLPDIVPQASSAFHYFIVAFQPAGASASQPVAVSFPNILNQPPGTASPLITLDPTRGVMVQYGTATVSADGRQIVPDADPAHPGHLYGLQHFDWHGPQFQQATNGSDPAGPSGCKEGGCKCPAAGGPSGGGSSGAGPGNGGPFAVAGAPVDLATGITQVSHTDISLSGGRGTVAIVRNYRSMTTNTGPFGLGTSHDYGYQLNTSAPQSSQTFNVVFPNGTQHPFSRRSDGTFVNGSVAWLQGVVIAPGPSGAMDMRWREGTMYRFTPYNRALGSLLTAIIDHNGNQITFVRDSGSPIRIDTIVDPVGRQLLLSYDSSDRITSISDPIGRTVSYAYNAQNLLQSFTDAAGGTWTFEYDAQNRLLHEIDARGVIIAENTYDTNGRVISQKQADGGVLGFAYTQVNPGGCPPPGAPGGPGGGGTCWPPSGPVIATVLTKPDGRQERYRFNAQGYLLSMTDALGQTRTYEHAPGTNQVTTITGTGGCSSCGTGSGDQHFAYDALGNLTQTVGPMGETTAIDYEPSFSAPTKITDPLNQSTTLAYDYNGNLKRATDANGNTTNFEYDANGLLTAVVDALGHRKTLAYDAFGGLIATTDALGNTTRFRYDGVSRLMEVQDALGRRTQIEYDNLDRIVSTTDGRGYRTLFFYDEIDNLTKVRDANNNETQFAYDGMGRQTTRTDALAHTDTWSYDATGNVNQHTDRRGQVATFLYDADNRLTEEDYEDSKVVRTYDAVGNLAAASDTLGGDYSFTYDQSRNLLVSTAPNGSIQYTRDLLGRATAREVQGQSTVTYTYDSAGNLTRVAMPAMSVDLGYDMVNRMVSESRANGVVSTYGYDDASRLTSIRHTGPNGDLDNQVYEYDAARNMTAFSSTFAVPLITQAVAGTYSSGNRLDTFGGKTFMHDMNGSRVGETDANGTTTYTWDSRSRLKAIQRPDGTLIEIVYDFGRELSRITKTEGNEIQLVDDKANLAWRRLVDGSSQYALTGRTVDHDFGIGEPVAHALYSLIEIPNSTAATVDESGRIHDKFGYEPFGASPAAANSNFPFFFTGRSLVTSSLYYYRARIYDSVIGAFLSEDPSGFGSGSVNLYSYAGDSPLDRRDPFGLATVPAPLFSKSKRAFCDILNYLKKQATSIAVSHFYGFWLEGLRNPFRMIAEHFVDDHLVPDDGQREVIPNVRRDLGGDNALQDVADDAENSH